MRIIMPSVRPGQKWERRTIPKAPWRPVEVVNVLGDEIELRFLDMPGQSDLDRTFSTKLERMSGSREGKRLSEYRFVGDS